MPRRKQETLMLKLRVRPTRPMRRSELWRLIRQAVRTGYVPDGIELDWIDWQKGGGRRARSGQIDGDAWEELRKFYGALVHGNPRLRMERTH